MNRAQQREIVATLIKAGRKDLAQQFVGGSLESERIAFRDAMNQIDRMAELLEATYALIRREKNVSSKLRKPLQKIDTAINDFYDTAKGHMMSLMKTR